MTALAGTGALVQLILRRDRLLLPVWILIVALVPVAIAASFAQLYRTPEALQAFAEASSETPATVAILGFVYSPTVGGLTAWRSGIQSAFLIVPVSLLLMVRYTRTDEEAGRRELLGSTVVGRHAPLTAALLVVLGANLLIAAVLATGLVGVGLPVAGALALGLSAASAGWVFAAVAGLAAQLAESPGVARGISLAVFGLAFLVRLVGDSGGPDGAVTWLSRLSPLGWMRLTRAFADERWWVFALPLGLVGVLAAAAFAVSERRDVGAGLLPPRLGPATAVPWLRSPLALAWRQHRGSLLAWTVGAAVFGFLLGAVGHSMSRFVDLPQLDDWVHRTGAHDAGDAFLFTIVYVLGQIASAYAIAAVLGLRSEELDGRADPLLAAPVGRWRWAVGHLVFAALGPTVALVALGLAMGLAYGSAGGEVARDLPRLTARAVLTLPAVWVMAGLAAALYGLIPHFAAALSWAALAVFLALELAWELQQVSLSVFDLSPFAYVHWTIQPSPTSLVALTALAAALTFVGLTALRRRDLGT